MSGAVEVCVRCGKAVGFDADFPELIASMREALDDPDPGVARLPEACINQLEAEGPTCVCVACVKVLDAKFSPRAGGGRGSLAEVVDRHNRAYLRQVDLALDVEFRDVFPGLDLDTVGPGPLMRRLAGEIAAAVRRIGRPICCVDLASREIGDEDFIVVRIDPETGDPSF